MSIRFPHELAAAAEFAERAVETAPAPAQTARFADVAYPLGLQGEPIRVSFGPGFKSAEAARKLIPGQTYH
ncbi:MAG: hypothetical protein KDK07_09330 [Bauldia sp.]|nr:hypothetical protein [Bauldia sp.]